MIKPLLRAELKWILSVFQMNFLWKLWQLLVMLMLLILTSLVFLKIYYFTSSLLELLHTWSCRHQPGTAWGRVWRKVWISPSHPLLSGNTSQKPWKQSKSDACICGLKELHWSGQNWWDQCYIGLFQDNLLKIQSGQTKHPCMRLFREGAGVCCSIFQHCSGCSPCAFSRQQRSWLTSVYFMNAHTQPACSSSASAAAPLAALYPHVQKMYRKSILISFYLNRFNS